MHEQDFEKQVQHKMEELSLTPSAPVWQKVEEQIRKKKDRRRLIFWLLPLLLTAGGAGWLFWGSGDNVAPTDTVQTTGQRPASSNVDENASPTSGSVEQTEPITHSPSAHPNIPTTIHTPAYHQPDLTAQQPKNNQPKLTAPSLDIREVNPVGKATLPILSAPDRKEKEAVQSEDVAALSKKEPAGKETTSTESAKFPVSDATISAAPQIPDTTNKTTELVTAPVATTPSALQDSATVTQTAPGQKAQVSKWHWTAHAEAGVTSVLASLFKLPATRSYDVFSSPTLNAGSNFFAYYPSPQEEALALSAGLDAKRIVSRRMKATLGVQYNFYSTRMVVGQEKNAVASSAISVPYARQMTTADNSYLPGTQNHYSNRYHFIQLPVGIEYQLFRKLPLHLHGGVSLAYMVKTNALTYDFSAQAYYPNKSAFHATQWHLFSNLTYTVWKVKSKKLDVGPYIQYSLTELQKTTTDQNRLFSAGLRTQLSF